MDDIKIVMTFHEWTLFMVKILSFIHEKQMKVDSGKKLSYSLCLWIGFLNPQPVNAVTNINAI